MGSQLLDIQPCELQFLFELKKQSSCTIRLLNKSTHHVAFKVKTTSPKKYCVRPNVGVIMPKSSSEFTVTMQAQRSPPPDMSCKDKFLVQSTIVPAATSEEDITAAMFSKEEGKFIQENKLRVSLVSPSYSPVASSPSPVNGTLKQERNQAPVLMDQGLTDDDFLVEPMVGLAKNVNSIKVVKVKEEESLGRDARVVKSVKVVKDEASPVENATVKSIKVVKDEQIPVEDARVNSIKVVEDEDSPLENETVKSSIKVVKDEQIPVANVRGNIITVVEDEEIPQKDANIIKSIKMVKDEEIPPHEDSRPKLEENNVVRVDKDMGLEPFSKDVKSCTKEDKEEPYLVKDVEEMKLKLSELESKLSKAEVTITQLREESGLNDKEKQVLNEKLVLMRSRHGTKTIHDGFPLLFVVMVALISSLVGYLLH